MKKYKKLSPFAVSKDSFSQFLTECSFTIPFFTKFPIQTNKKLENIIINQFKIIILAKGAIELTANNVDYKMRENDICIIPPMCLHSSSTGNEEVIAYELFFSIEQFKQEIELIHMLDLTNPKIITSTPLPYGMELVDLVYQNLQNKIDGGYIECLMLIYDILIRLSKKTNTVILNKEDNHTADSVVNNMLDYIQNNYEKTMSVIDICNELKVSQSYLYRCCKEVINMSPSAYITYFKMSQAQRLLKDNELNIKEIALKLGFSNVYYFSNAFKKYFNISPTAFRNNSNTNVEL